MINQDFEMENSGQLLWFFGGVTIGTAAGIAAAGRIGSSETVQRLRSETARLNKSLGKRTEKMKQTIAAGAGDFKNMIRKNLVHPIPDLYKATENFTIGQPEKDYDR